MSAPHAPCLGALASQTPSLHPHPICPLVCSSLLGTLEVQGMAQLWPVQPLRRGWSHASLETLLPPCPLGSQVQNNRSFRLSLM